MPKQPVHRLRSRPKGPWLMTQTWKDVLFAHWPLPPRTLQTKIPEPLEIDTYDGQAWIGIVPFNIVHLRARFLPPMPFAHAFPEVNVRTYVTFNGQPGVYFFSLDAEHRLAVLTARKLFHLPYFYSDIKVQRKKGGIHYRSHRPDAMLEAAYEPSSTVFTAEKDSLDAWLTERYRLYTTHKNKLYALDIHHHPWALQRAEAIFTNTTLAASLSLHLPDTKPLLHYAKRQKVFFWPLYRSN
ncbi:DUF2071 domain-containing protein [Salicibibacter halophilus]|uniref:DUF2071 domain-containing protein n=1 Tax=Salicibibacter halophilus TaxID=2502791 RepID=A0A514LJI0_9BACI|nr:DUF2071 domain-containing protein [Salicibibacter halophilus]QDI91675.1 DUF2071 domain-containing protein [Salicibibacter halophilus]